MYVARRGVLVFFFFQAEDGIRDVERSRGLGDVYKGQDMDHSCGGVCACSTCHVIVRQGLESCNEATDDEEDMLDLAPGLEPQSRLACQCVPNGTQALIIEIPEWNRNLVSEDH